MSIDHHHGDDSPERDSRDRLTGLANFAAARARLRQWREAGERRDAAAPIHALLLGLRRFETVNLAYGEAAGDGALVEIAARLTHFAGAELDGAWLVARGVGGSFLVMANEACSRERWQLFAEQLADLVARPIGRRAGTLRLSPRLALLRVVAGERADSVFDRLAQTLAVAKRPQGRRIVWASGEDRPVGRSGAQLEADLLKAIDGDEIEILFQPQFVVSGAMASADPLTGAEALARWRHPELGRIGAGALFAIAERADHIVPLSRHIAASALTAAARWPAPLRLSLNVTADDLAAGGFAETLARAIDAAGFPPHRLTLEVTEQMLLADMRQAADTLNHLAGQGIAIALDDFGAGFCNFHYLKMLPLHYLKLDRSMVDNIVESRRDLAVLRAIIAMAGALDLAVIAEGIEHESQRNLIRAEGCTFWQGFLRAQPLAPEDFLALQRCSV